MYVMDVEERVLTCLYLEQLRQVEQNKEIETRKKKIKIKGENEYERITD